MGDAIVVAALWVEVAVEVEHVADLRLVGAGEVGEELVDVKSLRGVVGIDHPEAAPDVAHAPLARAVDRHHHHALHQQALGAVGGLLGLGNGDPHAPVLAAVGGASVARAAVPCSPVAPAASAAAGADTAGITPGVGSSGPRSTGQRHEGEGKGRSEQ